MKNRILLLSLVLTLVTLLPVGLWALLGSEAGSHWVLRRIMAALPAQTQVAQIEGTLLDSMQMRDLHYETAEESVKVSQLALAWQPSQLFTGTLKLVDISLDGISIVVKQAASEASAPTDWQADILLPLRLMLDKLSISNLHYEDGETSYDLQNLEISAFTEDQKLNITRASLVANPLKLELKGQLTLGSGFPYAATVNWQWASEEYGLWQAETRLQGDVDRLTVASQQSSPFQLSLRCVLSDLQTRPIIDARGDWKDLRWPLIGAEKQFDSEQGSFEIKGPLEDYRLTLFGPLSQDYLPGAQLRFDGTGSTGGLTIQSLSIASDAGAFLLSGSVDWQTATVFDLNASGKQFNPAIFYADLPGQLTFDSHIKGSLAEDQQTVFLAIKSLQGKLRGNPVSANGQMTLANDDIWIQDLQIHSGRNLISANGRLSPAQSDLTFDIDTPKLAELWPGLTGSLKANGKVSGDWQHPQLALKAEGKALRFAEQAVEQLLFDLDYQPDSGKSSRLKLEARQIKTADTGIATLGLQGNGTPQQHSFSLDINSPGMTLSSKLDGAGKADTWQGTLQQLRLDGKDLGSWQLAQPVALKAKQSDIGISADVAEACLTQKKASLCIDGQYQANTDFSARVRANGLPTELLNPYLPSEWQLKSQIDANAEFRQSKGQLAGDYRLEIPANAKVMMRQSGGQQEIRFGGLALQGDLKNSELSGDARLGLSGEDKVSATWRYNTRSSQLANSSIRANIQRWELLQPLLPGVSNLSGQLVADLSLSGKADAPDIRGTLDVTRGTLDLAEHSLGLRDIDVHARAGAIRQRMINIDGALTPVLLAANDTGEALDFKGRVAFSAEFKNLQPLAGQFRVDLPADSSVSYTSSQTAITVPFAASSVVGEFADDALAARLDLNLRNQDFIRGRVRAGSGANGQLDGQIDALLRDLSLVDVLVPDLMHTQGQLKAGLSVKGKLDKPVTQGAIELTQGATEVPHLGIALKAVNLHLTSLDDSGERFQIQGSAQSGSGRIKLDGVATLNGTGDITLQGQDFEVAKLPEAQVAVSPTLHMALSENSGKVTGNLAIPKALISLQEIPANAVTVSPDEVVLGQTEVETKAGRNLALAANVDIELGKQVHFSGMGLDSDLTGRLKITRTGDKTAMHGTIDMEKGRYQSYGQDLTVKKGRFLFNGPVDAPWLDVQATRLSKDQNVTAILNLSGPLKAPKTSISSEPALPEADALAYLITGSPLNQVSKSDGNMVASAALSYGAGQLSWITEKLGVDEFEVKQGKTLQDTLLAVGQYLTPDFYVGTKVGIFNRQAMLVLKHKLTKTLNVETQTGTSQRVKLNYEVDTD